MLRAVCLGGDAIPIERLQKCSLRRRLFSKRQFHHRITKIWKSCSIVFFSRPRHASVRPRPHESCAYGCSERSSRAAAFSMPRHASCAAEFKTRLDRAERPGKQVGRSMTPLSAASHRCFTCDPAALICIIEPSHEYALAPGLPDSRPTRISLRINTIHRRASSR